MDRSLLRAYAVAALLGVASLFPVAAPAVAAGKIPITKLSDLPTHTYTIPVKPSELITNQAAILELANAMEKDIRADLAKYDIQDVTAVRRMNGTLANIA